MTLIDCRAGPVGKDVSAARKRSTSLPFRHREVCRASLMQLSRQDIRQLTDVCSRHPRRWSHLGLEWRVCLERHLASCHQTVTEW
jgi:hypothetical protein